jgi:hypothetical protein
MKKKMGNKGFECITQSKRCEEIVKNINVKYFMMESDENPIINQKKVEIAWHEYSYLRTSKIPRF